MAHQGRDDGVKVKRSAGQVQAEEAGESRSRDMTYEYGKPPIGMALGAQRLFPGDDAEWETRWEAPEPDATATLWRYMSFAKFCSLLERRELFFSVVGNMEDRYEGSICPPRPRDQGDRLQQAESIGRDVLHKIARSALINCWTMSEHESALMWEAYAGTEGVAVRTTFQDLKESIFSDTEATVIFGQVNYVD